MKFREQLIAMNACNEAVEWVGDKTLAQAWNTCKRGDWMGWLLAKLDINTRAAAADIAETVWHLIEPQSQLACAWAIDCARRGADDDEVAAARTAIEDAAWNAAGNAAWAAGNAAGNAIGAAARAAGGAIGAAARAAGGAIGAAQQKISADILREHFTAAQVEKALKRLAEGS
jgi:hypothetical protein